jgi:hypothetical protein
MAQPCHGTRVCTTVITTVCMFRSRKPCWPCFPPVLRLFVHSLAPPPMQALFLQSAQASRAQLQRTAQLRRNSLEELDLEKHGCHRAHLLRLPRSVPRNRGSIACSRVDEQVDQAHILSRLGGFPPCTGISRVRPYLSKFGLGPDRLRAWFPGEAEQPHLFREAASHNAC